MSNVFNGQLLDNNKNHLIEKLRLLIFLPKQFRDLRKESFSAVI
jgi:hypothetical protein